MLDLKKCGEKCNENLHSLINNLQQSTLNIAIGNVLSTHVVKSAYERIKEKHDRIISTTTIDSFKSDTEKYEKLEKLRQILYPVENKNLFMEWMELCEMADRMIKGINVILLKSPHDFPGRTYHVLRRYYKKVDEMNERAYEIMKEIGMKMGDLGVHKNIDFESLGLKHPKK